MDPNKTMEMERRDFLKVAGAASGLAAVSGVLGSNAVKAEARPVDMDEAIQITDPDAFKERYDTARTVFSMMFGVQGKIPLPEPLNQDLYDHLTGANTETAFKPGDPGYTQLDYAFRSAAEAVDEFTGSAMTKPALNEGNVINFELEDGTLAPLSLYGYTTASYPSCRLPNCFDVAETKYKFETPEDASYAIKKAAKVLGASLVGIAPYDERFVYRSEPYLPKNLKGELIKEKVDFYKKVDFGFEPKSVIVMAFEMDYEAMKAQATQIEWAATAIAYSRMTEVSLSVATFIRKLGYNAIHCGNGKSMSVPEAIRAGLGEGGRNGILITEEYGPRVRIAKVYTDLECAYDKPKRFGVTEFCEVCQLCSDACPSEAITKLSIDDPENKAFNTCQQGGTRKYYNDYQKCYLQWRLCDNDCGICISVCPYNKPRTWNHDLMRIVTRVPVLNSVAKYFDEFFGYGGLRDAQTISDFWKRTI